MNFIATDDYGVETVIEVSIHGSDTIRDAWVKAARIASYEIQDLKSLEMEDEDGTGKTV